MIDKNSKNIKINVLGTEYTIYKRTLEEDVKLQNANGYCDSSTKEIVVEKIKEERNTLSNLESYQEKVLRHEIVHAFLYESGLHCNAWSNNEEIVDWIAIQLPKIQQVLESIKKES
ncbi:MAG: hypothetical protein HUJ88_02140 [Fusobacterium necrophorum]|nr:hypothetical protein [Fusobacterium necrophorum]